MYCPQLTPSFTLFWLIVVVFFTSSNQKYTFDEHESGKITGFEDVQEIDFKRSISSAGVSSYRLNGQEVSQKTYEEVLFQIGIVVKARNSLVFQGDVENVSTKSPVELMEFFEQISGSSKYIKEYKTLETQSLAAEKETVDIHHARRAVVKEVKHHLRDKKENTEYEKKKLELAQGAMQKVLFSTSVNEEQMLEKKKAIEVAKHEALEAAKEIAIVEDALSKEKQAYHKGWVPAYFWLGVSFFFSSSDRCLIVPIHLLFFFFSRLNETKNDKNLQKQQDLMDQLLPAQIQLKEKVNRGKIQIERATVEVKLATNNVSRLSRMLYEISWFLIQLLVAVLPA